MGDHVVDLHDCSHQPPATLLTVYYVEDESQHRAAGGGVGDVHGVLPHVQLGGVLIQHGPVVQQVLQGYNPP